MNKITINPHNCSHEEYQELLDYLDGSCWDYSSVSKEVEHTGYTIDEAKCMLSEIPEHILKILSEGAGMLLDMDDPDAYIEIGSDAVKIIKPKDWKKEDYTPVILFERKVTRRADRLHSVK